MHELSIVMNILDTVEEKAIELNASVVHEIEVDIGELSGVECDALEFAMENSPKKEILKHAILVINRIHAKARCKSCGNEFDLSDFYTPCPNCGKFDHDIFQGKELKVKAIKID